MKVSALDGLEASFHRQNSSLETWTTLGGNPNVEAQPPAGRARRFG